MTGVSSGEPSHAKKLEWEMVDNIVFYQHLKRVVDTASSPPSDGDQVALAIEEAWRNGLTPRDTAKVCLELAGDLRAQASLIARGFLLACAGEADMSL